MTALATQPIESRHALSGANDLSVTIARTLNDIMQVNVVRALVYMGDQACPYDEEFDGNDLTGATHLILRKGDEPIGVVRMRWFADFAKFERLAIRDQYRGGPGLMMLSQAAIDLAGRKGYRTILGHAQTRIVPFWKRYFKVRVREGRDIFCFSDFDYVEMEFDVPPRADAITIDTEPMVILRPEGEWDRPGVIDRSLTRYAPPRFA